MSRFFAKSHGPHHSSPGSATRPGPSSLPSHNLSRRISSFASLPFPIPTLLQSVELGMRKPARPRCKTGNRSKEHTHPLAAPCGPGPQRHRLGCTEQRPQEGIISYSYRKFNKFPLFPPSPLPAPTAQYGGILIAVESENKPHVKANSSSRSDDAAQHKCDARICTKITATRSFFYLN